MTIAFAGHPKLNGSDVHAIATLSQPKPIYITVGPCPVCGAVVESISTQFNDGGLYKNMTDLYLSHLPQTTVGPCGHDVWCESIVGYDENDNQ